MELLVMPGFGLDEGHFHFLCCRREDAGAGGGGYRPSCRGIFAAPARFAGKTFEIASDSVTGRQLEALFSAAAGRPITYSRFSDEVLAASPFLHKLTGLVDDGRLAGTPTSTPAPAASAAAHLRRLAGGPRPSRLRAGADQRASWAFNR